MTLLLFSIIILYLWKSENKRRIRINSKIDFTKSMKKTLKSRSRQVADNLMENNILLENLKTCKEQKIKL